MTFTIKYAKWKDYNRISCIINNKGYYSKMTLTIKYAKWKDYSRISNTTKNN